MATAPLALVDQRPERILGESPASCGGAESLEVLSPYARMLCVSRSS
jgi:hypothetical protein